MAITPQQKTAITAKLSVSLSTLTDDKLIELCLLYRSAPEALPTFPDSLETEITRRFTAAEIAANDVMFSVCQNFSNQFNPELQYKEKIYELVNAVDRELWIAQNISFFEQLLEIPERMAWVVANNQAISALVSSVVAMNAVAASSTAMAIVKESSTAMAIVSSSVVAMNAVAASSIAMNAVVSSTISLTAVVSSVVAMNAVAASSTAMAIVSSSIVAMNAVAASSMALAIIVKSAPARDLMMTNNTIFQSLRDTIFSTIKQDWTKERALRFSPTYNFNTAKAAFESPNGFVLAYLGRYSHSYPSTSQLKHPNGNEADKGLTRNMDETFFTLASPLDGISFNGASLEVLAGSQARAVLELWTPSA